MSQISSQIYDPNLVSIPFAKFSHNTSPYGSRNFIWNHIGQRDDLDLVIRHNRVIDEHGNYATRVMLKITAGVDVLEAQDLEELVNFTRSFDSSSGAEQPVQVVIRCPFLAMKYPKTINAVRRIQLKFKTEDDFKKAFSILKDLGFPITEVGSNYTSVSRPSISPAQLPFSSTSTPKSTILASSLQPSSTQQCSTATRILPPISEFKIPIRPDTRNSETPRPNSAQSFSTSFDRPVSASTTFSAPTPPSSVSAVSPLYDARNHPSLLYPIQHEGRAETLSSYGAECTATPGNATTNSLCQSQDLYRLQESSDRTQTFNNILTTSPFFSDRPVEGLLNRDPADVNRLSDPNAQTVSLSHCAPTRPDLSELTDKFHDLLPPKRELPFPKRGDGDRGRPSSMSELPPLPKPTLVRKAVSPKNSTVPGNKNKDTSTPTPKPAKKPVAQRKRTVKKPPEAKLLTEQQPERCAVTDPNTDIEASALGDEVSPLAAKTGAARPPSVTSGLQSKATTTRKRSAPARPPSSTKKPKMVDQCTQTQTLSGRDHTTALSSILRNENSAPIATEESRAPPPQSYLDLLDTFMTRNQPRPASEELWERPGYAEGDEEHRQAILNDFICENLENPQFLQLCEDTEKAWRRIGFGR